MRKAFRIVVWVFAAAFALELVAGGGLTAIYFWWKSTQQAPGSLVTKALSPPKSPAEREAYNRAVFDAVWGNINSLYIDRNFHGLDWNAIRTEERPKAAAAKDSFDLYWRVLVPMVARLNDSHTNVIPPEKPTKENGCKPIDSATPGFQLAKTRNRGVVVTNVRKGSAADLAGIEPDWLLRSIGTDGACTRAPVAKGVVVSPDGKTTQNFSYVIRPMPPEPERTSTTLASGVRVLRFDAFNASNIDWLIDELRRAPTHGVILDLRANHGGISNERVAGALLPPNSPIGYAVTASHIAPVAMVGKQMYSGPLVVLIGPASASSSEVIAEVMRFNRRAILVGEPTAGAVESGGFYPLPDGGKLQVTSLVYLDPTYRTLEGVGVNPDIELHPTLALIRAGIDQDVQIADQILASERAVCGGQYCPEKVPSSAFRLGELPNPSRQSVH